MSEITDLTDTSDIYQHNVSEEDDTPTQHRNLSKTISIRETTWRNLRKLTKYDSSLDDTISYLVDNELTRENKNPSDITPEGF